MTGYQGFREYCGGKQGARGVATSCRRIGPEPGVWGGRDAEGGADEGVGPREVPDRPPEGPPDGARGRTTPLPIEGHRGYQVAGL